MKYPSRQTTTRAAGTKGGWSTTYGWPTWLLPTRMATRNLGRSRPRRNEKRVQFAWTSRI